MTFLLPAPPLYLPIQRPRNCLASDLPDLASPALPHRTVPGPALPRALPTWPAPTMSFRPAQAGQQGQGRLQAPVPHTPLNPTATWKTSPTHEEGTKEEATSARKLGSTATALTVAPPGPPHAPGSRSLQQVHASWAVRQLLPLRPHLGPRVHLYNLLCNKCQTGPVLPEFFSTKDTTVLLNIAKAVLPKCGSAQDLTVLFGFAGHPRRVLQRPGLPPRVWHYPGYGRSVQLRWA